MTILDTIADYARIRVAEAKKQVPLEQMRERAKALDANTGFPFEQALRGQDITFICEVKKASPSRGIIAEDFPYLQIAKEYEAAGANAISVLTEPKWFKGDGSYLQEIANTVSIPCIRKDFIVDEYQIYEAKTLGASAILLIVSLLDTPTLRRYRELAESLGMSALVETHDDGEVASAIEAGVTIIGVNNRNLKDFTVDFSNSARLRPLVPQGTIFVAESGVETPEDINELRKAGTDAVLIGETLMRATDKKQALDHLKTGC